LFLSARHLLPLLDFVICPYTPPLLFFSPNADITETIASDSGVILLILGTPEWNGNEI